MKKSIICFITALVACMTMNAQDLAFERGSSRINFGAGVPNTFVGDINVPPVYASYEYGIVEFGKSAIGIGGAFEYASTSGNNTICSEIFGKYHFNFTDRFDIDGHLGLGYGVYGSVKGVAFSIGADANYKIANFFGVFGGLEAGSIPGKAFVRGGIFFQF